MNSNPESIKRQSRKALITTSIAIPVALLHFVTGPSYRGPFPDFVNGYLIDILLPFALYFLLCPQDSRIVWLRHWYVKAVPVFLIGFIIETAQYSGIMVFGSTFDPLDYAAYALGILLAVLADTLFFPRIFSFWQP
ncbi:MAG: hypothetical protein ABIJ42_00345 [Acidobacteriota bacterium]